MSTPPRAPRAPRTRSAFAAAFLSLLFPGLGHAYAGAWMRALAWAAVPLLSIALLGGIILRANRIELLGFVVQQSVLIGLLLVNVGILVYRVVAAIDAWNVARFLNDVDASGTRPRRPLEAPAQPDLDRRPARRDPGHGRRAHRGRALQPARDGPRELRVLGDRRPELQPRRPTPPLPATPGHGGRAPRPTSPEPTDSPDVVPSPIASNATGTQAPSLPPWDGKERLNILLVGVDQRNGDAFFNTDTLIVASIDPQTKEVAMFQVPRDTVDVPVPPNARSVWGSVYRGKINSWYAQNRVRGDLWHGATSARPRVQRPEVAPGRALRARHPVLRDGQLPGLPGRRQHARRRAGQRPDPGCRERLPGRRRRHPHLHPGRPPAHERRRRARLRPFAPPGDRRRLRPRPAPAAGPRLAARPDERASRSWPTSTASRRRSRSP